LTSRIADAAAEQRPVVLQSISVGDGNPTEAFEYPKVLMVINPARPAHAATLDD